MALALAACDAGAYGPDVAEPDAAGGIRTPEAGG